MRTVATKSIMNILDVKIYLCGYKLRKTGRHVFQTFGHHTNKTAISRLKQNQGN